MNPLRPSAVLSLLLFLPDPARACSCGYMPKPYAERRLDFPVVFHGKVTATEVDESATTRWIRLAVIKDYGVDGSIVADTVTVWTPAQSSACGVYFPVAEEVLVFASNPVQSSDSSRPTGKISTGLCHMNISGAELPEALRGMDEATGVRARARRVAAHVDRTVVDCGKILFEGMVQANGVLRRAAEKR